jgi:hypothetical protein
MLAEAETTGFETGKLGKGWKRFEHGAILAQGRWNVGGERKKKVGREETKR